MHKDPTFKGRHLAFSSDLSIAAPLRRGLVPALDAVSYKTRAQRLLDTLHAGRQRNHEHAYARLFSDAVERVAVIQSVRVALLEPEDKLLLTVSFDGNWDAYIRTLWVKVGGLLDAIFCNTEDYVEARLHSCEAWAEWVRQHQVQTRFFYGSADGSATDLLYLRRQERLRQDRRAADPEPPPAMLPRAEQRARETLDMTDATIADAQWPRNEMMVSTMLRQGLQSLAALYRLTDWYVPGTPDGEVLHRAAHELLQDFVQAWDLQLFRLAIGEPHTRLAERFARQLAWLIDRRPPARLSAGGGDTLNDADRADIQGGIVQGYDRVTHAALLLFTWPDAQVAAHFLQSMRPELHTDADGTDVPDGQFRRTLFVTLAGLRRLGLDDATVDTLPEAFVQGMAARAGLLGDRHDNHPERWNPPRRLDGAGPDERIDLGAVHGVLYLRVNGPDDKKNLWNLQAGHPLEQEILRLRQLVPSAALLAVEPLRRLYRDHEGRKGVHEHFGFADGNGQPGVGHQPPQPDYAGNNLPYGEFLLGHPGRGDVQPVNGVPARPERQPPAWLRNSSFLVVRKYRQWPDRFDAMLRRAAAESALEAEVIAAKLMGRGRDGVPLVRPGSNNNQFTYLADPQGRRCPLHAHIRRANPRRALSEMAPGEREPRILRRSVSFGPRLGEPGSTIDDERGLMFMAFNANIAEQFEVVQRWLTGGHSTDTSSGIACPIVGVPEPGRPRRFEFDHAGRLARITLDGEGPMLGDAEPLARLEWGAYWLAPSLGAIDRLAALAAAQVAKPTVPFSAAQGRQLLHALQAQPALGTAAWKAALEDADSQRRFDSASLWAAVRQQHGGAMRCPMGVLVGSRAAVAAVLEDAAQRTTVEGYAERMDGAMGRIFLGLDDRPGSRYAQESAPVRQAIEGLCPDAAYAVAQQAVDQRLDELVAGAKRQAEMAGDPSYELVFDERELVDEVLARLCERWFGLDDAPATPGAAGVPAAPPFFDRGGFRWDADGDRPRYPGHFMAPSRYIFQPDPECTVRRTGERHAQALTAAMRDFLSARAGQALRDPRDGTPAEVGRAVVDHPLSRGDPDFAARTMVGAIMGFVPTMDGALRAVLTEWRRSGEWARMRRKVPAVAWTRAEAERELAQAMDQALQLRCVPDLVWRRASAPFEVVPGLQVKAGETLVLGLGSAAHESLEQGRPDDTRAMFGGVRDASGGPTHACPGYVAARAAMLGALAGLLCKALPLQELPAPGSWRITGPSGVQSPLSRRSAVRASRVERRDAPIVLCWGDSWLDYREVLQLGRRVDMLEVLRRDPQFRMQGRGSFASFTRWGYISTMADQREVFLAELQARFEMGDPPQGILLSGGGNDSTGQRLEPLLAPFAPNPPGGTRLTAAADAHVASLKENYRRVLSGIRDLCDEPLPGRRRVPVLMHGYDHPQPGHGISNWLWPVFTSPAIGYPRDATGRAAAAQAMKELIDRLNTAQRELIAEPAFTGFAHHVDLRNTFSKAHPGDPSQGWSNELHPTEAGFSLVAAKVATALQAMVTAGAPVNPHLLNL